MTTKIIPGNITNTGVTAGSYISANITAMPDDGKLYQWDEATTSWEEL